jgi:hypothetical protein
MFRITYFHFFCEKSHHNQCILKNVCKNLLWTIRKAATKYQNTLVDLFSLHFFFTSGTFTYASAAIVIFPCAKRVLYAQTVYIIFRNILFPVL